MSDENSEQSEQVAIRREKLRAIRESRNAYPNDVRVTSTSAEVLALAPKEHELAVEGRTRLTVAGRILANRLMGKAAFSHLQDRAGRVQIYVKKDEIGEVAFSEFKSFDLGDIVEASGYPFITKTGEPSLHVTGIRLLVKCLHPLPEKWHGLTDVEVRYRQRYLDLMVNPEVKETFLKRAQIIAGIREFFNARDYVEVETPVLGSISSGAAAKPFVTHHNALDLQLNLRIALELPLKRLVVGGVERVYEIGRVFRNEGISTRHNPEFTMIEFYQAYATYQDLIELTEDLVTTLLDKIVGGRTFEYSGQVINCERPWRRLTMAESIHEIGEVSRQISLDTLAGVHEAASQVGLTHIRENSDYGSAFYELFDKHVQPRIVHPTFITRFPTVTSPLSRLAEDDPRFVDRFELFISGMEVANAFSELNDPDDQRTRFEAQLRAKAAGDDEAMEMDEDFVQALEYGMPPTAGEGIGIDRLVMLLTAAVSIRDVILFPQMRPLSTAGSDN